MPEDFQDDKSSSSAYTAQDGTELDKGITDPKVVPATGRLSAHIDMIQRAIERDVQRYAGQIDVPGAGVLNSARIGSTVRYGEQVEALFQALPPYLGDYREWFGGIAVMKCSPKLREAVRLHYPDTFSATEFVEFLFDRGLTPVNLYQAMQTPKTLIKRLGRHGCDVDKLIGLLNGSGESFEWRGIIRDQSQFESLLTGEIRDATQVPLATASKLYEWVIALYRSGLMEGLGADSNRNGSLAEPHDPHASDRGR